MDEWTEIRRKVLVEGASKRSIHREYGIGHQALAKILANPEPPGYQMAEARRKPVIGPFLGVIDEELERLIPGVKRITFPDATHQMWLEHPTECRKAVFELIAAHH